MSNDNESIENNPTDLHSLLSPHKINDWGIVCRHIQRHPHQARERYYRHESPLQLALTARGECNDRMNVLRSLVDADPASIHSRDDEGRTPLHTACAAGRSNDILRWLIYTEDAPLLRISHVNEGQQRSVTLRTDFPGGALPLHLIAACSTFDCIPPTSSVEGEATDQFYRYSLPCAATPDIISAYSSTTCIWQAYPEAVWERDCEGEIPLHAAASWGNVGAILSLLIATAARENNCLGAASSSARRAVLTTDDRNKTPFDRACDRFLAICVDRSDRISIRRSIPRDDPFEGADAGARRRSLQRSSQMMSSSRRRIPGCGSSLRLSFSSSHLAGVNLSFISFRKAIDPTLGIDSLDGDGEEELAKIEMLAKAAYGFFEVYSDTTLTLPSPPSRFQLLHAVIALGCAPEICWHAAATYPHQVEEKDELGRCPLFVACDRLAECTRLANQKRLFDAEKTNEATEKVGVVSNKNVDSGTKLVQSLLLGENYPSVLDDLIRSPVEQPSPEPPTCPRRQTNPPRSLISESRNISFQTSTRDDEFRECASLSWEIIDILLRSSLFGKPEMASISDAVGRLPLHVILEAGLQLVNCGSDGDDEAGGSVVLQSLIDVYPRALEIKDGKTGLLPFMIAATPKSPEESTKSENGGCTRQVQTIYQLLLKAPNAIALSMM